MLMLASHAHFWCTGILSDENNKSHVDEKKFNEIKINLGKPLAAEFYKMLKKRKIYDFKGITVEKTIRQYHEDLHQVTATDDTIVKERQMLSFLQKEISRNEKLNRLDAKLQMNV